MDYLVNFTTDTVDDCPLVEPICVAPASTVREALATMKAQNSAAVLVLAGREGHRHFHRARCAGHDGRQCEFRSPDRRSDDP